MKMKERMRSVLIVLILTVAMTAPGFSSADYVWADDGSDVHYIAVGADRHDTPTAIANAMGGMPETVEYVCLNGDMTDFDRSKTTTLTADQTGENDSDSKLTDEEYDAKYDGLLGAGGSSSKQKAYNTSTVLKEVTDVFPQLNNTNVSIVYGSHDANATDDAGIMKCAAGVPTSDAADHDYVSKGQSGPIFAGENYSYLVYGVSYYDMMDADDGKAYAKEFEEWVDQQDSMIPLIVICHVPIHKASEG